MNPRWSRCLERALVFVAANDNARAGLNRSARYYLFLERGVLEYQSLQRQCSAIDDVHCLLFEPGRALLGQAVSRIFSRGRSDLGARLADAKAAGARSHLRRGEIRGGRQRFFHATQA